MAPKLKVVSELGSVVEHGNGWRAWVKFSRDEVVRGPTHYGLAARRKAEADLARARQASTRDEMQRRLRDMRLASAVEATPLAEPLLQAGHTHPSGSPHPAGEAGGASCVGKPAVSHGDTGVSPHVDGPQVGRPTALC